MLIVGLRISSSGGALDRDDYNVDLQYRYQEENTDPQVEKTPEAYGTADRIPDQSHL